MAVQSLYNLLNSCVVFVTIPAKRAKGTGFFVAPGKILTCAHVVEPARTNNLPIEISWQSQTLRHKYNSFEMLQLPIWLLWRSISPTILVYSSMVVQSHGTTSTVLVFPTLNHREPQPPSKVKAGSQLERLKFQQGQARPGMSGSPLLNWDTGGVCAIVQLSYSTSSAAAVGGSGLLTKIILQEFPELQEQQKQYHQQHREWIDSMTAQQRQKAGLTPPTPVAGTTETFEIFFSYAEEDEKLVNELRILSHQKPSVQK